MVVATDICPTVDFEILKRSPPFLVDDDVVNLVDSMSIWGSPTQLVDVFVAEDGTTYHTTIVNAIFDKPLCIVVDGSTTMLPHRILAPNVINSNFRIQSRLSVACRVLGLWRLHIAVGRTSRPCLPRTPRW